MSEFSEGRAGQYSPGASSTPTKIVLTVFVFPVYIVFYSVINNSVSVQYSIRGRKIQKQNIVMNTVLVELLSQQKRYFAFKQYTKFCTINFAKCAILSRSKPLCYIENFMPTFSNYQRWKSTLFRKNFEPTRMHHVEEVSAVRLHHPPLPPAYSSR